MIAPPRARVDTVRLQDLSYAYRQSAVLMAAIELGVFTHIAHGAHTIEAVAEQADITVTNAERLLTACAAMDLVQRAGAEYHNAPDVERFLVEGERGYAGPWLLMSRLGRENWSELADALRRKEPPRVLGSYENFTEDQARTLHDATYSVGMGAGRRFAKQVDLSGRKLMLDLGGGSGCYCITATQQYPDLRAIVFDLPPVTVVAREFIAKHGLSDRIDTVAGNFVEDDVPTGADVITMASNLPQYNAEFIRAVVAKAFAALEPGGEMHLLGELLWTDRTGPVGPALWGVAEAFAGSTGVAHSETDVVGYFEAAGFADVGVHEFVPGSLSRVTGRKPG